MVTIKLIQGTLVPKLTLDPSLKLSVKVSTIKVDNKNYDQHFIKHDEDNNSQFKLFKNQNYNRSSFYINSLDR